MSVALHKVLYRQICTSPYFQNVRRYLNADDLRGVNKIQIITEEQIALEYNGLAVRYGFVPAGIFDYHNDILIISNEKADTKGRIPPTITYAEETLLHELGHFHGWRTEKHAHDFIFRFYFSVEDISLKYYTDFLNSITGETFAGLYVLYKCGLAPRDATALFKGFGL